MAASASQRAQENSCHALTCTFCLDSNLDSALNLIPVGRLAASTAGLGRLALGRIVLL